MNPIKILKPNEFTAVLRGLNLWTLRQKLKDHTTQRVSTIQLLNRIDIYNLTDSQRKTLLTIEDSQKQQQFIKEHGKLAKTTGTMKSHSFTVQFQQIFIEWMMARVSQTPSTDALMTTALVRDDTNTLRLFYDTASAMASNWYPAVNAPTTNTTYGILVGTGVTAPTTLDYTMQTLIAHGVASGNLQYQATSVGASGVVGANTDTIIARVLVNGSGGTVTITEVGIKVAFVTSVGSLRFFLIARDVVSQAVNNGAVAIVSYDIRTTI
jgi:hypothetical protein